MFFLFLLHCNRWQGLVLNKKRDSLGDSSNSGGNGWLISSIWRGTAVILSVSVSHHWCRLPVGPTSIFHHYSTTTAHHSDSNPCTDPLMRHCSALVLVVGGDDINPFATAILIPCWLVFIYPTVDEDDEDDVVEHSTWSVLLLLHRVTAFRALTWFSGVSWRNSYLVWLCPQSAPNSLQWDYELS